MPGALGRRAPRADIGDDSRALNGDRAAAAYINRVAGLVLGDEIGRPGRVTGTPGQGGGENYEADTGRDPLHAG